MRETGADVELFYIKKLRINPCQGEFKISVFTFLTGYLKHTQQKATSLDIRNVEFIEQDMQNLEFSKGLFDIAVCAFGIFFVEDMDSQLSHIVSTVRPGGRIMISNFQENYFDPLKDMLFKRLGAYGVEMPPQIWKRIASDTGCRQLFEQAGLTNITVSRKNVGYYLDNTKQWWDAFILFFQKSCQISKSMI